MGRARSQRYLSFVKLVADFLLFKGNLIFGKNAFQFSWDLVTFQSEHSVLATMNRN